MAKYTGFIYQGGYYGNAPRLVLNAEPMDASAIDYGKILVRWNPPSGNFTKIRLVRNNDNFSETEEDGVIIWEQASTTDLTGLVERDRFIDGEDNFRDPYSTNDLPITPGQFIYYTIFLFTSSSYWIPAGYATTLMPKNRGSQNAMLNLLPRVFTSPEKSPTGVPDPDSFLATYLKAFSFTYDQILTSAELLAPSFGKRKTPPFLVPLAANNVGLYPEIGLPFRNQKKLIRESLRLYKLKGTQLGIQNYVEAVTNYIPTVTLSPNIFLDTQDSSFTRGVGRWTATNGALTSVSDKPGPTGTNAVDLVYSGRVVTAVAQIAKIARTDNVATITMALAHGLAVGDSVTVAGVATADFNGVRSITAVPTATTFRFANTAQNVAEAVATGTVTNCSTITLGKDNPVTKGTPVTGSTPYRFSYYAASDSNGNVVADVTWHNYLGAVVGSYVQEAQINGTTGVYQRFFMNLTAPATAVYATYRFIFTTQNSYNIDCIQLAPQATATNFDEARGIDIFLDSSKVNIIANPSFETNTNNWTTNSSKTRVADVPPGLPGGWSCRFSGQNSFSVAVSLNTVPTTYKITEGNTYIFSAYLKASAAKTITATLSASDDDGGDSDTSVATWALTTDWKRYSVRLFVPVGFSTLGNITMAITLAGTLTGENIFIDNAQFEKGFIPTDYFDGSLPEAQGVFWSSTAHASYSYCYVSRTIKVPRLLWTLGEWMSLNQPYRIRSYKGFEGDSYSRNA